MKFGGHLRLEEFKLPPGQEWTDESTAWRFLQVSQGSAYWLDRERPRALNAGEVVVAGPGLEAVVRASQLNEVWLHAFAFAPDLLCGFLTLAERRFFEGGAGGPAQFLPTVHPLAQRFAALVARGQSPQTLAERAELLGLVGEFFGERIARYHLPRPRGISAQKRFREIICQMPDLEIIQHTPEEMAALCGCSLRHFHRLFRMHFGVAPRKRQTQLRLLKARQLLSGPG